ALDPAGIELFEQPCAAGDWDAHLTVARAASVPMMLDESVYGLDDIDRAAELGAASYIKVKLMKLGTLDRLAAAIAHIKRLGIERCSVTASPATSAAGWKHASPR